MISNKNILINKKRFKIPEGYFNSVKSSSIKTTLLKPKGFQVPVKYFENLDKQQIFNRTYINKVKYIKYNFYRVTAIAAMFIGIIFLSNYFDNNNNDFNSVTIAKISIGLTPELPKILSIHCCGPNSDIAVRVIHATINKNNGLNRD